MKADEFDKKFDDGEDVTEYLDLTKHWKLIEVYEFDTPVFQEIIVLRVELFSSSADEKKYKYRVWKYELFRLQSTVPSDENGKPADEPSDETILSTFFAKYLHTDSVFCAAGKEEALNKVKMDIKRCFEYMSGKKVSK